MANGQYSIPGGLFEAEQAAAFSAQLDAEQYTPESHPEAYDAVAVIQTTAEQRPITQETVPSGFGLLKPLSDRLDSYRSTAVAIEENRSSPSIILFI